MSRGYGVAQRAVLAEVQAHGADEQITAAVVAERHDLHIESARRAIRSLWYAGVIMRGGAPDYIHTFKLGGTQERRDYRSGYWMTPEQYHAKRCVPAGSCLCNT